MCIGAPGKIILIKNKKAKVRQKNHCHWLDISFLEKKSKKIKKGDYLISYQGIAVNKVPKKEAKEIYKLLD